MQTEEPAGYMNTSNLKKAWFPFFVDCSLEICLGLQEDK